MGPIGHIGYFRPRAEALWRETLAWLRAPLAAAPTH
jgi:predicted alpha/beta hydrolase